MTNEYGYDPIKLIGAVERHPNLWDRTDCNYQLRIPRLVSWDKVYRSVIENFDDLPNKDQETVGATLTTKWNNIRDAFIRSVKKTVHHGEKKKYIYCDNLLFLLKNLAINQEEFLKSYDEEETVYPVTVTKVKRQKTQDDLLVARKSYKKSDQFTEVYIQQYNEADSNFVVENKTDSEDEAFFASILPTISKYTDDEKLEFRMDVLSAMKKIRDKRI